MQKYKNYQELVNKNLAEGVNGGWRPKPTEIAISEHEKRVNILEVP